MKKKIPVIFRKIDGYIDGFLPTLRHSYGRFESYWRFEGHNEADYFYAIKGRLATEDEYKETLKELRTIYEDDESELVVRKKIATYWKANFYEVIKNVFEKGIY